MILDIRDLGDRTLPFELELQLDESSEADGRRRDRGPIVRIEGARLRGKAAPGERGVALVGTLEARVQLECSRCVEPYAAALSTDFELTVVRESPVETEEELELDRDDLDLLEVADGRIDLREVAHEQLWLNVPLKPVCRADCRGLCPTCGGNRNRIECGCSRDEPDPRLATLLEFKRRAFGPDEG